MRVILLENVIGLGRAGDIKNVKDGFARNFLIPQKMVEIATRQKEAHINKISAALAKKAKKIFDDAMAQKADIEKNVITMKAKAGEENRLFGSITNADIALAIKELGYDIDKKKILVEHIKTLGEHTAKIRLDEGVTAEVKVNVVAEAE